MKFHNNYKSKTKILTFKKIKYLFDIIWFGNLNLVHNKNTLGQAKNDEISGTTKGWECWQGVIKQQQAIIGVLKSMLEMPRALVRHENFLFGQ